MPSPEFDDAAAPPEGPVVAATENPTVAAVPSMDPPPSAIIGREAWEEEDEADDGNASGPSSVERRLTESIDGFELRHPGVSALLPLVMFRQILEHYRVHQVVAFAVGYFFVKGMLSMTLDSAQLPLFKDIFHVSSQRYQKLFTISLMAWGTKPLIGLVSDAFPLWDGRHKRGYMLLACLSLSSIIAIVASLPGRPDVAGLAAALLFCAYLMMATLDLLTEGCYTTLINERPAGGPALISFLWGLAMLGQTIASLVEGPLADCGAARLALWMCVPIAGMLAFPMWRNWLGERPSSEASACCRPCFNPSLQRIVTNQRSLAIFGLMVTAGAMTMALTGVLSEGSSQMFHFIITAGVGLTLVTAAFCLLPLSVAKAAVYMFIKQALYVQVPGVLDYYYTAKPDCVFNGPHFTYTYYQTVASIVGCAAGVLGVVLFHRYFEHCSIRTAFWMTSILKIGTSFADFIVMKRWNVRIGIPDSMMFMTGGTVIWNVVVMLDYLPATLLISQLCPKGMESTMFALLAGMTNVGDSISRNLGWLLTDYFGVVAGVEDAHGKPICNFDHAPTLILVAHCFLPMLVIPFTFFMVPKTRMNGPIESLATIEPPGVDGAAVVCALKRPANTPDADTQE